MFSKNLRYLRNRSNMEQIDLANRLGRKSASSVSEWEKGKYTPKVATLNEIAKIFNVTINDLMERDLSNISEVKNLDIIPVEQVPVVSSVSAGDPIYSEENIIDYAFVPSTIKKNGKEFFYLIVSGDSMDREFNSGDLVLVEKGGHIENGQIGVVALNGDEATVKRIKYDEDKVYLIPESNNPEHMPKVFTEKDDIRFIGKVVSMTRTF